MYKAAICGKFLGRAQFGKQLVQDPEDGLEQLHDCLYQSGSGQNHSVSGSPFPSVP